MGRGDRGLQLTVGERTAVQHATDFAEELLRAGIVSGGGGGRRAAHQGRAVRFVDDLRGDGVSQGVILLEARRGHAGRSRAQRDQAVGTLKRIEAPAVGDRRPEYVRNGVAVLLFGQTAQIGRTALARRLARTAGRQRDKRHGQSETPRG